MSANWHLDVSTIESFSDGLSLLVLTCRPDGIILRANTFASKILGADTVSKHVNDILVDFASSKGWVDFLANPAQTHLVNAKTAGGIPETFRVSLHPAGENVIVTGEYDHDDLETLGTSLLSLTQELSNLTRELHKKNADLTKLNELKNRFLGMAAHDLRHPIGAIASYSEFLSEELGEKLSDEQANFLTIIHSSSRFMSHLINNLLDVSAIESGKFTLDVEMVDVPSLVGRTVMLHKPVAGKKGITIESVVDGHIPNIVADPGKVEQVVSNLLSNGIKFSPPHTTIMGRIATDGDAVVVSVSDQGQGIPREEQDKLFKPFSKTSVRSTAGERSTGLGLAIAKNIVAAHGGQMWVESEPGKGSTFFFSLPFKGK